jgi:hypothetical protein
MIDQLLARRGYGYGSGMLSPDCSQFVVNIPKNASSFILDWTNRFGWRADQADQCAHRIGELIIVLRDPVDRWVSGISQYINSYILSVRGPNGPIFPDEPMSAEFDYSMSADDFVKNYNQLTERLLFDVIFQFDDHVWPQVDFFKDLCTEKRRTYFYLDKHFEKKLSSYLNIEYNNEFELDRNSSQTDVNKRILHNFFAERLELRPELKSRIVRAYSRDYDLINNVKFK